MREGVNFTVLYTTVAGTSSLCIIIAIAYGEVLILFVLDIYNSIQNIILPNTEEIFYLSLPRLYLKLFKIKCPKHPLASINEK